MKSKNDIETNLALFKELADEDVYNSFKTLYGDKYLAANYNHILENNPRLLLTFINSGSSKCRTLPQAIELSVDLKKKKLSSAILALYYVYSKKFTVSSSLLEALSFIPNDTIEQLKVIFDRACTFNSGCALYKYMLKDLENDFIELSFDESLKRIYDVYTISDDFKRYALDHRLYYMIIDDEDAKYYKDRIFLTQISLYHDECFYNFCKNLSHKYNLMKYVFVNESLDRLYEIYKVDENIAEQFIIISAVNRGATGEAPHFYEFFKIHLLDKSNYEKQKLYLKEFSASFEEYIHKYLNYIINNEYNKCAEDIIDLTKEKSTTYKALFNAIYRNLSKSKSYQYMFISEDEYIAPLFNNFKEKVYIIFNKIMEQEKQEEIEQKYNNKKSLAQYSLIRINQFLSSNDTNMEKFYVNSGFNLSKIDEDKELVKEFYPDVYQQYLDIVTRSSKQYYAIANKTADKLAEAIVQSKYKLPLLDFCYIYNPKDINEYFKDVVFNSNILTYDNYRALRNYHKNISAGLKIYSKELLYNENLIIAGHEFSQQDKTKILDYIKSNHLPPVIRIYKEIARLYAKHEIDLDISFKDFMENRQNVK